MEFGLSESTLNEIIDVFEDFPMITEAVIFGSRAMGNHRHNSDIDIALKGAISFAELLQVNTRLDDLMLPYYFDTLVWNDVDNDELLSHLKRRGKTIYSSKAIRSISD